MDVGLFKNVQEFAFSMDMENVYAVIFVHVKYVLFQGYVATSLIFVYL
jgi:hypothetical protein